MGLSYLLLERTVLVLESIDDCLIDSAVLFHLGSIDSLDGLRLILLDILKLKFSIVELFLVPVMLLLHGLDDYLIFSQLSVTLF